MNACDAIGLAVFVVDAGVKSIRERYNMPPVLFVSIITGVGAAVSCGTCSVSGFRSSCAKGVCLRRGGGQLSSWFAHPYLGMTISPPMRPWRLYFFVDDPILKVWHETSPGGRPVPLQHVLTGRPIYWPVSKLFPC